MTERNTYNRRELLRGGLFGVFLGVATGGTAESMNIRGIDREFQTLQDNFRDFLGYIGTRTRLGDYFPGGMRRLTDDKQELSFLFSSRRIDKGSDDQSRHHQLMIPSANAPSGNLTAAIRVTDNHLGKPTDMNILTISAFFKPDGAGDYALFDFDNLEYPNNSVLKPSQMTDLPGHIIIDDQFASPDDWTMYFDESEQVRGEVFRAEKVHVIGATTVAMTVESCGYIEYTEVTGH